MTADIVQLRLLAQHIEGEKFRTPEEVVRWMGAMQAQDYGQALWAIASRTQSSTITDIERAIAERKIVRTWPIRGTIHFIAAEDAHWLLAISAARTIAKNQRRLQQLELDEGTIKNAHHIFQQALRGGKCLTRATLLRLLEDAGIRTENQRGYQLLWHAAHSGLICFGPNEQKQQTFVLLDEWAPSAQRFSREEALGKLVERYLHSHGPATVNDIAGWAGITTSDTKIGIEAIRPALLQEKRNDHTYWQIACTTSASSPSSNVHLLAGFDEYLLGYKNRRAMISAEDELKVVPGQNGIFLPMLVLAGHIVGTWQRTLHKNTYDIVLKPFIPLPDIEQQTSEAIKKYSSFLKLPISSISTLPT